MLVQPERYIFNEQEIEIRSVTVEDVELVLENKKKFLSECDYLMSYPDEITRSVSEQAAIIADTINSNGKLHLLMFVNGEFAGECMYERVELSRRNFHRAIIHIALLQKFTGQKLGRFLISNMLEKLTLAGYEQVELTMTGGNERAYRLYKSLGFKECGRISNAKKYDDGKYRDNVFMIKFL